MDLSDAHIQALYGQSSFDIFKVINIDIGDWYRGRNHSAGISH